MSYRAKKAKLVGPLSVLPLLSEYRIVDQGTGSVVLRARFKTRQAAERWIERWDEREGEPCRSRA